MLPTPLRFSLLFGGRIGHFGLLFQAPFCKWRWFQWRWRRRRRQRRTAATATTFLVVASDPRLHHGRCRWRERLLLFALRAMSLALRLVHPGSLAAGAKRSPTCSCMCTSRAIVCVAKLLEVGLCAVALVALVEIQAPLEVEELPHVVATQVL